MKEYSFTPLDRMPTRTMERLALVYLAQKMRETGLRTGTSIRDDVRKTLLAAEVPSDRVEFFCQSLSGDLIRGSVDDFFSKKP